jgi:hypothetical protein
MTGWYNIIRIALELVSFSHMLKCCYGWLDLQISLMRCVTCKIEYRRIVNLCSLVLLIRAILLGIIACSSEIMLPLKFGNLVPQQLSVASRRGKHDVVLGTFEMYSPAWGIRIFAMLMITKLSACVQIQLQN